MTKKKDFEDSLNRLEELIGEMESPGLPLNDLLKHFSEGVGLIKDCREQLDKAQKVLEDFEDN